MYPRRRMLRQAPSLVLLVTLIILALSACDSGGGGEEQAKARPLPEEEHTLRPGTYSSEEFEPSLTFRVGKGWLTVPPEGSDALLLERGEEVGLGFINAQEVYKPTKTGTSEVVEAPEEMVSWFQQHPYLQTDKPEPVTVGGVKGQQFDVVVEDVPEDHSGACGSDCVDIFRSSSLGWIAFREANKQRVVVLEDVKGETVTMGFTISATEFDEVAPEAQKVLDSVKWRNS